MTDFEVLDYKIDQVHNGQSEIKKDIDKLVGVCSDTEKRIVLIESWMDNHEERDKTLQGHISKLAKTVEPLVDDYKIRMSRKKWTDKILWLLVSFALLTALGNFIN